MSETIYLKDYKPHSYHIDKVDLVFNLEPSSTIVEATMKVRKQGDDSSMRLDGTHMELLEIKVDGVDFKNYSTDDKSLTLTNPGNEFELYTKVKINPSKNLSGEGLYQSDGIFCTQCEAEGFRRITYFIDRPDNMAAFTTKIIADKKNYPILLSNGNDIEKEDLGERHSVKWEDPFKKPSYLFALVAGDLGLVKDKYKTTSGRNVRLEIYVDKGNESRAAYAMESLKKSMKWDEDRFGLEYDLDIYMIVSVDSFNMGAMENKGLNIFNASLVLADNESADDRDFQRIEGVIGHEYFHNWTGNRVTCRDWFQLTLKEGLTVFRDQEFSGDMNSPAVNRIDNIKLLRSSQFTEDASAMSHPIRPASYQEISNFYSATVYEKGSEVIRMIHTILGEENFQKGMKLYFKRHDGTGVTTDDFIAAMSDASGIDLSQFKNWYNQSGTPVVTVKEEFSNGEYKLKLNQVLPKGAATANNNVELDIPLKIKLFSENGAVLLNETLIRFNKKEEDFSFKVNEKPILSFNRTFTAPLIVNFEQSNKDLMKLLEFDDDAFVKYNCAEKIITDTIMNLRDNQTVPSEIVSIFKKIINDKNIDPAFLSFCLTPPTESDLNEKLLTYDVEGITKARKLFYKQIGENLYSDFLNIYEHNKLGEYKVTALDIGRRSLKNMALTYMIKSGKPEAVELAKMQFDKANNMTDSKEAYKNLLLSNSKYADEVDKTFYNKWCDESLVMNKWFSIQASRDLENMGEHLEKLSKDKAFDATNPNKIRHLYGSFASNFSKFHAADGSGYQILSKNVLDIDKFNPQIASRAVKYFGIVNKLDSNRKNIIVGELKKISATKDLSADVSEVVNAYLSRV